MFRKGDTVTVIDGGTDNPGTEGCTGTVVDDGSLSGGLIAVKGIDGRFAEAIKGYRGYTADQIKHA
ncbi:hypothetical protein ACJ6WF_17070 [Streptomyces sp. MMS24-I2-30]|uniref:hypothetical protein n=1 Tax=Streptomyces sp. MMS24-I2-30 TaxID=3351564 RepID=UPI003896B871